jgi:hypothetical protein
LVQAEACRRFYTAGAGDRHFGMLQSVMLKALEFRAT